MEEQEMKAVVTMSQSNGFKHLRDFIQSNIKSCDARLSGHGKEIESLEELKAIQSQKQAYESVLNFVQKRKKKLQNNT